MRRSTWCIGGLIVLALVAGAAGALAQGTETDQLQQLRADIRADRQALVAANLGLTDAEGQAFWPVYRQYHEEMAKLGDRMQKVIQDFARVYEAATALQAKSMIDEMMRLQKDELKVKEAYLPKFRKVLPEVKVARFLQIENKIDAVIRFDITNSVPLIQAAD